MAATTKRGEVDDNNDARLLSQASTLTTSYIPSSQPTPAIGPESRHDLGWRPTHGWENPPPPMGEVYPGVRSLELGSTGKGILIGMLSAFGSAALVCLLVAAAYFFRYTSRGRIFLDRIARPGEFDDEQQFLREEEEALAHMDDSQRGEYSRAKGRFLRRVHRGPTSHGLIANDKRGSICTCQSTRVCPDRHFFVTVFGDSREGSIGMGV